MTSAVGTPTSGAAPTRTVVRLPVIRALLDDARRHRYVDGVLGIRAAPSWSGPGSFTHEGVPVRVVACRSTLAVREALLGRGRGRWLVLLTDRDDDDLGAGVLTHLAGHRLRTPDPWEAVRYSFSATGIDAALTGRPGARDLAHGLLTVTPAAGWPAARGGVLTRDHAFAAVAAAHLAWAGGAPDLATLLEWSTGSDVVTRLGDLREAAADALPDAVLEWFAAAAAGVRGPVEHLLRTGQVNDLVPWGLVMGVVADALTDPMADSSADGAADRDVATSALIRAEAWVGAPVPAPAQLTAWSELAAASVLARPTISGRVLARADELLRRVQADGLAVRSSVLRAGLDARLVLLAEALRRSPQAGQAGQAGQGADDVEAAWDVVRAHRLADDADDARLPVMEAAVRLQRWLATAEPTASAWAWASASGALAAHVALHTTQHAWVDTAAAAVADGTGHPDLDTAFEALVQRVRTRRAAADLAFAAALAAHTLDDPQATGSGTRRTHAGVWHVEDLLRDVVLPLAAAPQLEAGVLLLVIDGMSAAVAGELVEHVTTHRSSGWAEALLPGHSGRAATLAVLPTLTKVSRTSLLSGELREGTQADERRTFAEVTRAAGVTSTLVHKKGLDSSREGHAVADDVRAAVEDTSGTRLVACVLNAVDDALDRSDPGGTIWTADAIKHLTPLLQLAQQRGRIVVVTSDHGHVVERRLGEPRRYSGTTSGRSRSDAHVAGEGEVLVSGRRVLLGGSAVLAVDERVRFGPLKAGYHGGASPAEAVIPVVVLVPGAVPTGLPAEVALRLAAPQAPTWWTGPVLHTTAPVSAPSSPSVGFVDAVTDLAPTDDGHLFTWVPQPLDRRAAPTSAREPGAALAAALLDSEAFAGQRAVLRRLAVTEQAVRALVVALAGAPGQRMLLVDVARLLSVPQAVVLGPVRQVQQLLNLEGYEALRLDADSATLVLDEALLREQFELGS